MKDRILVFMLRSSALHPRILLRYDVTAKLLANAGIAHESIEARGKSALAQMLSLVFLGDYASFYLSMLNEVDPTSTNAIDFVKQSLAQSPVSTD